MAGPDEDEGMTSQGTPSGSGGGGRGGYTSFSDMFDGGGAGRSGARFEGGGVLSDIANMVATPRNSYGSDTGQRRPALRPSVADINAARDRVNAPYSLGRDLFDGGGLGRRATLEEINAGRGFRGGLLSNLANMFGVRPMGSNDLSLVASYDRARASRPDIVNQQGLLANQPVEQGEGDVETENVDPLPKFSDRVFNDISRPSPYDPNLDPQFITDAREALREYDTEQAANLPRPELNYEMPAGLLGQVQGEAAVIETTAKQLYDNDMSFLSLDQAREVVRDPVAYQSYIDSRR